MTRVVAAEFDPPLDEGVARYVAVLRAAGVQTFASCESGPGHACPEPTVRLEGNKAEGFAALRAALAADLPVDCLRQVWSVEGAGCERPFWEIVFWKRDGD